MEFVFPWPTSTGAWIAFLSAAVTAALGLLVLAAPSRERRSGLAILANSRSLLASFLLGTGIGCILLDQPLAYLILGVAWLLAVPGRLAGIAGRGGAGAGELILLLLSALLAAMPLAYVFGYIA